MNDQERMTDFLCSEKKMTSNYDTYASECVNIPLRDAFLGLFNQGHHTQTELFQLAQSKGWYQPLDWASWNSSVWVWCPWLNRPRKASRRGMLTHSEA